MVVIGCLGTNLESIGIQNLLVGEIVYGMQLSAGWRSVGNYIRLKRCDSNN